MKGNFARSYGDRTTVAEMYERLDELGGPSTQPTLSAALGYGIERAVQVLQAVAVQRRRAHADDRLVAGTNPQDRAAGAIRRCHISHAYGKQINYNIHNKP